MKNIFCLLLIACLVHSSCAQTKSITRARAFYYERSPGMLAVDDEGTPLERKKDTVITVYIEIKGEEPQWKNALKNGRSYSVIAHMVKEKKVTVGTALTSDKEIVIQASRGTRIIALELQANNNAIASPNKSKSGEILLEGLLDEKVFYYKVKKPVQIASPEFQ